MKKYILSIAFLFTVCAAFSQNDGSRTIDAQDTVVFNLAQQTQAGGYVQFPLYITSDDTINALDFTFGYNTVDFKFDTIIQIVNINTVYNESLGATDTSVLLTASTFPSPIPSHTNLITIRFAVLTSGPMCLEDIDSMIVYLNGSPCTGHKTNFCSTIGMADIENSKSITSIYPNPASENTALEFSLTAKSQVTISIHDITGKEVYETTLAEYLPGTHKLNLNLSGLENGIYVVRINSVNEIKSTRISVIK